MSAQGKATNSNDLGMDRSEYFLVLVAHRRENGCTVRSHALGGLREASKPASAAFTNFARVVPNLPNSSRCLSMPQFCDGTVPPSVCSSPLRAAPLMECQPCTASWFASQHRRYCDAGKRTGRLPKNLPGMSIGMRLFCGT